MSAKYLWNKNDNLWLCLLSAGFSFKAVWHTPVPLLCLWALTSSNRKGWKLDTVCKVLRRGLQDCLLYMPALSRHHGQARMRGRVWLLRATSLSLEQPGSFLSLLWNAVTQKRRSFLVWVWIHVLAALWVWALRASNTLWKEHIWNRCSYYEPDSRERMKPASHSSQRLKVSY